MKLYKNLIYLIRVQFEIYYISIKLGLFSHKNGYLEAYKLKNKHLDNYNYPHL